MSHAPSPARSRSAFDHTVTLLDCLLPPPRRFAVRLWDGTEFPAVGRPTYCLVLHHPGALRRMFTPPIELSLSEAFIYGDFDVEGDLFGAFSFFDDIEARAFAPTDVATLTKELLALPGSGPARSSGRGPARLRGERHSPDRDRSAVQYHYDVGDRFYSLWLDRRMQYSCAYFPTGGEDLDTAQELKLEHIRRKLHLKPGDRLLDIGCGWGGLAVYAAQHSDVQVLGITLSKNQLAAAQDLIAANHLEDRVSVKLLDYRELGRDSFDKVVSIGMFEHVGRDHLAEYFGHVFRVLKPGGLFLNHGISCRAAEAVDILPDWRRFVAHDIVGSGAFLQHYIFPDGELTPVSEVNLFAEEAGFEVRDVENLREHYALTLRRWVQRLEAHEDQAVAATDAATYRTWRLYLCACAHRFETGGINVNQTLFARLEHSGHVDLPLTRADLDAV